VSLNLWYSGGFWGKRSQKKKDYIWLIRSQLKIKYPFPKGKYETAYTFFFKANPLDASNCVAMLKMIEDVLFENDAYNFIDITGIRSRKGESDYVIIEITEK
jgi:hypothetical protein